MYAQDPHQPFTSFWDTPLQDLLSRLKTTPDGLTMAEALSRLRTFGPNALARERRLAIVEFLRFFANPLVAILIIASVVSLALGERVNATIILAMVSMSVLLNFYQEFQARNAMEALRRRVASTTVAVRDGEEREIPVAGLAPGDTIKLSAGSLVPADARLLEAKDLYVRESALTGESLPAEKKAEDLTGGPHGVTDAANSVFLGTAVQSGIATAVVVRTGGATAFGGIAARLLERPPETEFDRGIRHFALLIMRVILLLVLFVFLVNAGFKRPPLESLLFAVALAVGLTPELLPMLPTQILLNNFLYDTSQLSIPGDNVDAALLRQPKRWRTDFIRQFMVIIGPISSIYDFLTFGILLGVFHAGEQMFHTGWFVESLATQTLVVFVIRTAGNPLKSRPSRQLIATVLAIVIIASVLPYTRLGLLLGFTPLPISLLIAIALLTFTYLALVQFVKTRFYRHHALI